MKLEKAIEIKELSRKTGRIEDFEEYDEADRLSIEAMLYVERNRLGDVIDSDALLPGETKD